MKSVIFALSAALGMLLASAAHAEDYKPAHEVGEMVNPTTYCVQEMHARTLFHLLKNENKEGYLRFIDSPTSTCWDTRRHANAARIRVRLKEFKWVGFVTMSNGNEVPVEVWRAEDSSGRSGYIFSSISPTSKTPDGVAL